MPTESLNVRSIFDHALDLASEAERKAYLDEVCAGAPEIRQKVDALLQAYADAGSFLKQPAVDRPKTDPYTPNVERPGAQIGPYKLLQQIGEGGMGVVFMAEQTEPVERKVALKIIKPGMDSNQVIARFEAERQALALMDHPNVAKMLDAGTTSNGRPYFVMDLVKGVPIIQYCDEHHLTPRERLELFIPVCQAVQHAHQKGIIHRDIKPTNILVADYDDRPVAKIIDFGVAKAIGQPLTEKTMFTEFGQVVGTIEYMSPEQAKLNQLDIDTRTDIYSLGVLLYELLTGETPFDRQRLRSAAFDEMLRIIREEDPPKPSTRLSTSQSLPTIAANRHLEPKKLTTLVSGDLDWIVMKALEKDRARRYETAAGLVEDIQRYLTDQPVQARPPSRAYRLKKFIRRNKAGVLAGSAVAAALIIGLILATIGFLQARRQAEIARIQAARSEQVSQFLKDMLKGVGPGVALGRDTTMLQEIVDKTVQRISIDLKDQPEVETELRLTLAQVYLELQEYRKAEQTARETLQLARANFGEENLAVADALNYLGRALMMLRNRDEAEVVTRQAIAMQRKLRGNDSLQEAYALGNLADVLRHQWLLASRSENKSQLAEAETAIRSALAIRRKQLGNNTDEVAWSLFGLELVLGAQGQTAESEDALREALAIFRKLHGDEHPNTVYAQMALIRTVGLEKIDLAEAEAVLRMVLEIQIKMEGKGKLEQHYTHFTLAEVLEKQGKLDEAERHYRAALEISRKQMGVDYEDWPFTASLAGVLRKQGKLAEARQLAEEAVAICQRRAGRIDHWVRDRSFATLKEVLTDLGDTAALETLEKQINEQ